MVEKSINRQIEQFSQTPEEGLYVLTNEGYVNLFYEKLIFALREKYGDNVKEKDLFSEFATSIGLSVGSIFGQISLQIDVSDKKQVKKLANSMTTTVFGSENSERAASFFNTAVNYIKTIKVVKIKDNKDIIRESESISQLLSLFSKRYSLSDILMSRLFRMKSGQEEGCTKGAVIGWRLSKKTPTPGAAETIAKTIGKDEEDYQAIYKIIGVAPLERDSNASYPKAVKTEDFGGFVEICRKAADLHHKSLGKEIIEEGGRNYGGGRSGENSRFSRATVIKWVENRDVPEADALFAMAKVFEKRIEWFDETMKTKFFRLAIEQQKKIDKLKVKPGRMEKDAEKLAKRLDNLLEPTGKYADRNGKKIISPKQIKETKHIGFSGIQL